MKLGYIAKLIMTNIMSIVNAIGTIGAVIAAYASVKTLYPKAKPRLEKTRVSLSIHVPNTRTCSGELLVCNSGPKPCSITDIVLKSDNIDLPKYNLVAVNQRPRPGSMVGDGNTQKLPLIVEPYIQKQVFFRTVEAEGIYSRDKLPATVTLAVSFDCKKEPICKALYREGNTSHYS